MITVFLDRDGVINENRSDYVKNWAEFRFLPGSCKAMSKLTRAGYRIVVCTNQAGIARGSILRETLEDIHHRMVAEVAKVGGRIEKVYYCPHSEGEHCPCRKPRPGMLLRARDELCLDLTNAVFIGDSISDMCAGLAAGVQGILVLTGLGSEQLRSHWHKAGRTFLVAMSLKHAVNAMLRGVPYLLIPPLDTYVIAGKKLS